MKKVLNQEEIDALVKAARKQERGTGETESESSTVAVYDFRGAGQINQEQVRAVSALHEAFARNLSHSLAAYLRVGFEANLVSAEHMPFREFLARLPEVSYVASCMLDPMQVTSILELDLTIAFPIVDLLLGGQGKGTAPDREVTDIEEQLLEDVVRIMCRELQNTWQPLGLSFRFGQRQQAENVSRLVAAEEKILALSFEVSVGEVRGALNLAVPVAVSGAWLRKLARESTPQKPTGARTDQRLRKKVTNSEFVVELVSPETAVAFRELLSLAPGQLLTLGLNCQSAAVLTVAKRPMFSASPVRVGQQRAAHLLGRFAVVPVIATANSKAEEAQ